MGKLRYSKPHSVIITLLVLLAVFAVTAIPAPAQHKYPTDFGQTAPQQPAPAQPSQTPPQQPAPAQQPPSQPQAAPVQTETKPAEPQSSITTSEHKLAYDLKVRSDQQWTDTSIDLAPGDRITLTSEGTVNYANGLATPKGLPRSWREVISALPVNSAGLGALIGRIGNAGVEMPFMIGPNKEVTATRAGRLFLGINQTANNAGQGTYSVKVQITPATAKQAAAAARPIELASDLFKKIPRRIEDKAGNPGDMVNFIMIGPQEKMQQAFADAGWVLVDRTKTDAVFHALFSTYSKKTYTEMPMSELYLFGRPQDFGYAHAEPVQVVQTRHHLRVWKAPFEVDGQTVWVGAATHDIGFEHDNRSQSQYAITHKIDPNVDAEREFVSETLNSTGDLAGLSKVTPPDPLQEAKTATGGSFHSDGQVLVMELGK